jgi:ubiquitin-protein ligase
MSKNVNQPKRNKPRSPTSLRARGATGIDDVRLREIQRKARWQHQPAKIRRKALNLAKQKRSLRKIEAQLQEERDRRAGPQSRPLFHHQEAQPATSAPTQTLVLSQDVVLSASASTSASASVATPTPTSAPTPSTSSSSSSALALERPTTLSFTTAGTPTTPLLTSHQQPQRNSNRPSLPYDGENKVDFEARMHQEYLHKAKLRHYWGNVPDPWLDQKKLHPLQSAKKDRLNRVTTSNTRVPGRIYRKSHALPWESRDGWDEPQVTFQKNSKIPSVQWYTNRPATSSGTRANYSETKIKPSLTVPNRANRTWRSGPGRNNTAGRTAVPTPISPSNVRAFGSETTLEHMSTTLIDGEEEGSRSGSGSTPSNNTFSTSVDVARERLKVLNAQAIAFGPNGTCMDHMLSRGVLHLQPDESVVYDRHRFWLATIQGPEGSPYETATFDVRIVLGKYPTRPPLSIVFITPIFHPAVSYGPNQTLHMHWGDGVACWNRRYTLLAVVDLVLHVLRHPAAHFTTNHKAGDLYVEDLQLFAQCAGQHAVQDATGHGMSQKELSRFEDRVRLFQLEADMPPQSLSGAFVQRSGQLKRTQYNKQIKMKIAGHRMILFPGYGIEQLKRKRLARSATSSLSNSYRNNHFVLQDGTFGGRRFNNASRWYPGRRQLGSKGGFVKTKSTDRHFTAPDGIIALDSTMKVAAAKQRPSTAGGGGPVGSFDLRHWMKQLSKEDVDESETDIEEDSSEEEEEEGEGYEENGLPSARSDVSSGIDLEELSSLIPTRCRPLSLTLESTRKLYESGDYEESLSIFQKLLAGKEESSCQKMGSGNVVRAMMSAVRCYGQTME